MIPSAAVTGSVPPPRLVRGVLDPPLFESLRFYVAELARSGGLQWEEWGRRHIRHNDPFAVLVHGCLETRVRELLDREVKRSYAFLACYTREGSGAPRHRDRAQCAYTLDLCLHAEGPEWPLFVEDRPFVLAPNEALLYAGTEQEHHREPQPAGSRLHLVFFHFVDASWTGPLD
jgi:hypothetical protein